MGILIHIPPKAGQRSYQDRCRPLKSADAEVVRGYTRASGTGAVVELSMQIDLLLPPGIDRV